jgi:hypothetical protein
MKALLVIIAVSLVTLLASLLILQSARHICPAPTSAPEAMGQDAPELPQAHPKLYGVMLA